MRRASPALASVHQAHLLPCSLWSISSGWSALRQCSICRHRNFVFVVDVGVNGEIDTRPGMQHFAPSRDRRRRCQSPSGGDKISDSRSMVETSDVAATAWIRGGDERFTRDGRGSRIPSRPARRLLPDKGKPTVRWGRKATDQASA